jgi:hypothetical protein
MSYYAKFESHSGTIFRTDTRIYLNELPRGRTDGTCMAAIIGKNPGAASAFTVGVWGRLNLTGDKMLPNVRNIFLKAYMYAGKKIPKNAFVQVWNLFYLCDKTLSTALDAIREINSPLRCPSEERLPKIVWFAWGGDNKHLNSFKKRFLITHPRPAQAFFFDKENREICSHSPTIASFAKHPRGLLTQPIIEHLARIL